MKRVGDEISIIDENFKRLMYYQKYLQSHVNLSTNYSLSIKDRNKIIKDK